MKKDALPGGMRRVPGEDYRRGTRSNPGRNPRRKFKAKNPAVEDASSTPARGAADLIESPPGGRTAAPLFAIDFLQ